MTVSTTASRVSYSGNGSTTAFSFPYEYRASADLKVVIVSSANVATLKTLTTHYTVSGVSDSHGGYSSATVTMVTAPASGETLVLYRAPSVVQAADVESESDPLYAVNNALDLATLILQRLENDALKLPIGVTEAFSATLPDLPDDDGYTYYLSPDSARTALSWVTGLASSATIASAWSTVVNQATLALGLSAAGLGTEDTPQFAGVNLASTGVINWASGNATITHSTGTITVSGSATTVRLALSAGLPSLMLTEIDQAVDGKNWDWIVNGGTFSIRAVNDALNSASTLIQASRTGTTISAVRLGGTALTPASNDSAPLGEAATSWADLFLASGGVINWNNGTYTLTQASAVLTASGGFVSAHATSGVGYATGAGGAVTQITSRSTGVTLNKICGAITTDTTSLAAEAAATFTVTNSAVAINDTVVLSIRSGSNGGNTAVTVTTVAAGSFAIKVSNNNAAAGTAETGAIIINFAVIKSVSS